MSLVTDVQAPSKNAISKNRTPVSAAFLITKPKLCARHLQCKPSYERRRSQIVLTVSTMGAPIQKPEWAELIAESPPGANDGRPKCAAVDVWCSAVSSLTTPSSGEEAQAERSHAITKASIPHQAACLFTKPNLLIAERDATSGLRALMLKQRRHEKILRGKKSSRLVLHGRQLGRA